MPTGSRSAAGGCGWDSGERLGVALDGARVMDPVTSFGPEAFGLGLARFNAGGSNSEVPPCGAWFKTEAGGFGGITPTFGGDAGVRLGITGGAKRLAVISLSTVTAGAAVGSAGFAAGS